MLRPLIVLAVLAVTAPPAVADFVYLALGDSSAFGETDRTRNPSDGDRGYVRPFADYLAGSNGGVRPTVMNLAINGETTRSFTTGLVADRASTDGIFLNSNYAPFAPNYPAQRALMAQRLDATLAAGHTVGVVTVQLGANDLSNTAEAPGFLGLSPADQQAAIVQTLGAVQANYVGILTDIRTRLPNSELYVIGYHNPYGGSPGHPFYDLAGPAVQGLNQVIAGVAGAFGGRYVDFYTPVAGRERELTLVDLFPGDLINYVHLNDAGYAVVSQELIRTAAVPAPPAGVLAGLAVVGALAGRRLRRAG